MLLEHIDWEEILEEVTNLLEEGYTEREADAAVRALIRQRAERYDETIDFDALFNGKLEVVGDALEALDGFLIRTAMEGIYKIAQSRPMRLKMALKRTQQRLVDARRDGEDVEGRFVARLKHRVATLEQKIAALSD